MSAWKPSTWVAAAAAVPTRSILAAVSANAKSPKMPTVTVSGPAATNSEKVGSSPPGAPGSSASAVLAASSTSDASNALTQVTAGVTLATGAVKSVNEAVPPSIGVPAVSVWNSVTEKVTSPQLEARTGRFSETPSLPVKTPPPNDPSTPSVVSR